MLYHCWMMICSESEGFTLRYPTVHTLAMWRVASACFLITTQMITRWLAGPSGVLR